MTKRIRVLLAVDLKLVREGLRTLLSQVEDVEVVGEVETTDAVVGLARQVHPDVVLMDQDMPANSVLATRRVKEQLPNVEVIIITDRLSVGKAVQAIEAGATGYVLKDIPIASLASAIRAVCNGRAFFHPEITRKLVERIGHFSQEDRDRLQVEFGGLNPMEIDILVELAKGSKDRQISTKFSLSEGTVKAHIRHILKKLGVRNRTQAVAQVLRKGLID